MEPEALKAVQTAIETEMKKFSEETLVPLVKKQDDEMKKHGKATEETGKALSDAGKKQDEMTKELAEIKASLAEQTETIGGYKSKIGDLEEAIKKGQRPGWGDPSVEEYKSAGARFTEWLGDEGQKSLLDGLKRTEGAQLRSSPAFGVKRLHPPKVERKAVATTDIVLVPQLQPGIVQLLGPRLMIRDLMPSSPLGPPGLTAWVEETGFFSVATQAVTSITRSGSVATVTTTAAHGLRSMDRVQIAGAAQPEYNVIGRVTVTGATTFTYAVSGTPATPATTTTALTANRMNNFGAAAFVAEGSPKPEAGLKLTERTGRAEVIAHWLTVTRQSLDDMPGLRAQIDNRLLTGLDYAEEQAILYGNGSTPNVQGIMTHPNVQKYNWSAGKAGDNKMDAIRRAITRVQLAFMTPSGGVVNPLDFEDIETAKGSTDYYIWMQAPGAGAGDRVWRLPLVVTPAIVEKDFLIGAFAEGGEIREREDNTIRFSDNVGTNFTSNLLVILAEERMLPVWYRPEAFVAGDFDNAPVVTP